MCPAGYLGIISIHAPRAGGDAALGEMQWLRLISIHAPRAGGDLLIQQRLQCKF